MAGRKVTSSTSPPLRSRRKRSSALTLHGGRAEVDDPADPGGLGRTVDRVDRRFNRRVIAFHEIDDAIAPFERRCQRLPIARVRDTTVEGEARQRGEAPGAAYDRPDVGDLPEMKHF